MAFLDRLFRYGGKGEITLANANKTLTEDEASPRVLEFVGTLTAARTITLPNIDGGDWLIHNNTTGGYALTIAGRSGGATVSVANGSRAQAYYDAGAGVYSQSVDLSAPGAIGGTTPAAGTFTTLTTSSTVTHNALTASRYVVTNGSKQLASQQGVPVADLTSGTTAGDTIRYSGSAFAVSPATDRVGTFASMPAAAASFNGQQYTATDAPVSDWVCVSGVWRPKPFGVVGYRPPLAADFSTSHGAGTGSATLADSSGALHLTASGGGSGTDQLKLFYETAAVIGSSWRCRIAIAPFIRRTAGFPKIGLFAQDSTGGKIVLCGVAYGASGAYFSLEKYNSNTSYAGSSYLSDVCDWLQSIRWLELEQDGTTRYYRFSTDGVNFQTVHSVGRTDHLGTTPNRVGLYCDPSSNSIMGTIASYQLA